MLCKLKLLLCYYIQDHSLGRGVLVLKMPLILILMEDCLPFTFLKDTNAPFLTLLLVKNSKKRKQYFKNAFQDNLSEIVFFKKEEYMVLQMKIEHALCY